VEGWDIQHPTQIVEEFANTLEKELDYGIESANVEHFGMQFINDPTIYVPKIYREITTTRVLAMEYIDGIKASDIDRLEAEGLDRCRIARQGFDLIMKQIFVHRFFHADPHSGNIFILPNNVICYLDFGMMGRVDRQSRENFADLVMSVVRRDEAKTVDSLLKLTITYDDLDRHALERDVAEFIDRYLYRPLKEIKLGKLLHQLMNTVAKHRLRLPPDHFLMIKALITVEGLGRLLDPDFDVGEQSFPFLRRIQLDRLHPRRIARDSLDSGTEFLHLLKEVPTEFREVLRLVSQGKVKMAFEHRGLEPMLSTHDRISNRLAFAIVLASLVSILRRGKM
jgi:ubiquinone biosynthesis protein